MPSVKVRARLLLPVLRFNRFTDSVMAYKQRNKLGRFAEPKDEPASVTPVPANMSIGARCQVESSEPGLHKRGTVRFVGSTTFASGAWVGVEYDEPMGKNDGSWVFLLPQGQVRILVLIPVC
jgi:hypothetical protein